MPYVWLGAEERGISLLFDSPKGYDLEDGKPMLRLVRCGDTVTAEADVMSRAHEIAEPVEFAFAFEVTPVKPRFRSAFRRISLTISRVSESLRSLRTTVQG